MGKMKNYKITVEVEFTCRDKRMARERVIGIPFGDSDCGFRIVKIKKGSIPKKDDETRQSEYRARHHGPLVLLARKGKKDAIMEHQNKLTETKPSAK